MAVTGGTAGMTTRSLIERAGTFVGLVLVAIIFGMLVGPQFFAPTNLELMARQMAIVSIAAVGMTIVIVSGGIDSVCRFDDRARSRW